MNNLDLMNLVKEQTTIEEKHGGYTKKDLETIKEAILTGLETHRAKVIEIEKVLLWVNETLSMFGTNQQSKMKAL